MKLFLKSCFFIFCFCTNIFSMGSSSSSSSSSPISSSSSSSKTNKSCRSSRSLELSLSLDKDLLAAAKRDDLEKVKELLEQDANPDVVTPTTGCPPLHWAATSLDLGMINDLIANGANPHIEDNDGRNILYKYLLMNSDGSAACFLYCIKELEMDLETTDKKGNTLLHVAAENGSMVWIQRLLAFFSCKWEEDLLNYFFFLTKTVNKAGKTACQIASEAANDCLRRWKKVTKKLQEKPEELNDEFLKQNLEQKQKELWGYRNAGLQEEKKRLAAKCLTYRNIAKLLQAEQEAAYAAWQEEDDGLFKQKLQSRKKEVESLEGKIKAILKKH